jgi:hypothetical protein
MTMSDLFISGISLAVGIRIAVYAITMIRKFIVSQETYIEQTEFDEYPVTVNEQYIGDEFETMD